MKNLHRFLKKHETLKGIKIKESRAPVSKIEEEHEESETPCQEEEHEGMDDDVEQYLDKLKKGHKK
jgi:hypothetical protein